MHAALKTTKAKRRQCQMVTYGGFIILAGQAPKGKKERCRRPAKRNGFCEEHQLDNL